MISLGWVVSGGNFWFGILPILFMSFGDAITGIVRNTLHKKRTKSWWGNIAMALLSTAIGATMGIAGILAGATASLVEHFEFKFVDDNISIPSSAFLILYAIQSFAPGLLSI
jgi:phytol kinase